MSFSTPRRSHSLQDRYIAFCGAPAHLMGMGGWVNSAVPAPSSWASSQV